MVAVVAWVVMVGVVVVMLEGVIVVVGIVVGWSSEGGKRAPAGYKHTVAAL